MHSQVRLIKVIITLYYTKYTLAECSWGWVVGCVCWAVTNIATKLKCKTVAHVIKEVALHTIMLKSHLGWFAKTLTAAKQPLLDAIIRGVSPAIF